MGAVPKWEDIRKRVARIKAKKERRRNSKKESREKSKQAAIKQNTDALYTLDITTVRAALSW